MTFLKKKYDHNTIVTYPKYASGKNNRGTKIVLPLTLDGQERTRLVCIDNCNNCSNFVDVKIYIKKYILGTPAAKRMTGKYAII